MLRGKEQRESDNGSHVGFGGDRDASVRRRRMRMSHLPPVPLKLRFTLQTMLVAMWLGLILTGRSFGQVQLPRPAVENTPTPAGRLQSARVFATKFCVDCHDGDSASGGFDLSLALDGKMETLADHRHLWERVNVQLAAGRMPPDDARRPTVGQSVSMRANLETLLNQYARQHPVAYPTVALRRLNRTQYQNAVRDLLGVEVDAIQLLPKDEESHGFDNVTVSNLSPALMNRYLAAAEQICHQAVGGRRAKLGGATVRVKPDITQEKHIDGLPPGTRGGTVFNHHFAHDGQYELTIRLARDRNEEVEGLRGKHTVCFLLDGQPQQDFEVKRPADSDFSVVDKHLRHRFSVSAGRHEIGVTFYEKSAAVIETVRQPFESAYNVHRHPRQNPAIYQVSITGPWLDKSSADDKSSTGDASSPEESECSISHRLLGLTDVTAADKTERPLETARALLQRCVRIAYRRPVTSDDVAVPMKFFRKTFESDAAAIADRTNVDCATAERFDAAIEDALTSVLVNPNFLLQVSATPPGLSSGTTYRISDMELASRLSFFLWSSIPDDELLSVAELGLLHKPQQLKKQVLRMLSSPKAKALATNFAAQWLYLRNLESITPDLRLFPDFDDNLRQAMKRESELLFEDLIANDSSVLKLIHPGHMFLNERLAKHYGIPHVYGSHFRKVSAVTGGENRGSNHDAVSNEAACDEAACDGAERGGLLRNASVLTVTSYATRTSPTIRGDWILKNFLGIELPPPPPDVPTLEDNTVDASLPIRARLAVHRENVACASCHDLMDPIGFALENYSALGQWRDAENGVRVDAKVVLPDGREIDGVAGLEKLIAQSPKMFVQTVTKKLMIFAIGRGLEENENPALREIVTGAQKNDFRFSSLILGIVNSQPFQWSAAR